MYTDISETDNSTCWTFHLYSWAIPDATSLFLDYVKLQGPFVFPVLIFGSDAGNLSFATKLGCSLISALHHLNFGVSRDN